jgi:hypothetical protein
MRLNRKAVSTVAGRAGGPAEVLNSVAQLLNLDLNVVDTTSSYFETERDDQLREHPNEQADRMRSAEVRSLQGLPRRPCCRW